MSDIINYIDYLRKSGYEVSLAVCGDNAIYGDDLPDLCVLRKVGLPSCPKDAVPEVIKASRFVTNRLGGHGAVRELCDLILRNKP